MQHSPEDCPVCAHKQAEAQEYARSFLRNAQMIPWDDAHAPQNFSRTDPTPHIPISEGDWKFDWGALKWWLCWVSALLVVGIIWRVV